MKHSGVRERSGRQGWGTGLVPYQRLRREGKLPWGEVEDPFGSEENFSAAVSYFKSKGYAQTEIAADLGTNVTGLRNILSLNKQAKIAANVSMANQLKERGYGEENIAKRMKVPAGTVRGWLKPRTDRQYQILEKTTDALRTSLKERVYLDVGLGVETQFGITRSKLDLAIEKLKEEGAHLEYIKIKQPGSGHLTKYKVLLPKDVTKGDLIAHRYEIGTPIQYSVNGGMSYNDIEPPEPLAMKRVQFTYSDDEGATKDGLIEIRPGKKDLSLGANHHAQVRIQVGPGHFMKGVAVYNPDLPPGIDVRYNTSKDRAKGPLEAMKKIKDDPGNPFGAHISRQVKYDDHGVTKLSPINIVSEEGDWDDWANRLSSQFLSKQPSELARQQLGLALTHQEEKLKEIRGVGNGEVRRHLLLNFAESADTAARELKAAPMPGQTQAIIVPINSLQDNEVYAPKYKDGEHVVLIRHPHGGKFEIPQLVVNNRNRDARRVLGKGLDTTGMARDAIGINSNVAKMLSGADFDGDSVIVIPNRDGSIRTEQAIPALLNFDNKASYPFFEGMPVLSEHRKQIEMGIVSNLITDMTLRKAKLPEIVRAVRHSMVVIDAEKHKLNYKQSAIDHGIQELKDKYQPKPNGQPGGGSSTLVSRAKSTEWVDERKRSIIDPKTGRLSYIPSNRKYRFKELDKDGNLVERIAVAQQTSTKMDETPDAMALSSGTFMESIYGAHANAIKDMANKARAEAVNIPTQKMDAHAKIALKAAVESLLAKVQLIVQAKPHERRAMTLANRIIDEAKLKDPNLKANKDKFKKYKGYAVSTARMRVKAERPAIHLSEDEWLAIETGAVSSNVINTILLALTGQEIRDRFMPHSGKEIPNNVKQRAKQLLLSGDYTYNEIASILGISVSSVVRINQGD
jgi:transcriptional regulator with XRE-family HTH domain